MGVFLLRVELDELGAGLPHARGGVSMTKKEKAFFDASSPRSWGCFRETDPREGVIEVFPTLVGVFPINGGSPR